jgi:hypothetical protein
LDALQNRKAEEYNCPHRDPMRGNMQYHGSINQPPEQYQEADNVNRKRHGRSFFTLWRHAPADTGPRFRAARVSVSRRRSAFFRILLVDNSKHVDEEQNEQYGA